MRLILTTKGKQNNICLNCVNYLPCVKFTKYSLFWILPGDMIHFCNSYQYAGMICTDFKQEITYCLLQNLNAIAIWKYWEEGLKKHKLDLLSMLINCTALSFWSMYCHCINFPLERKNFLNFICRLLIKILIQILVSFRIRSMWETFCDAKAS